MAGLGKTIAGQQEAPGGLAGALQGLWDEATGAFARYGRRSGAQRDASLALLNQAVDPNTDPLTGMGMKALGLAGLITHPLAFFPTGDEWRERLANAGNTGRMGQAIGGMLGDLPSIVDPHLLAGGGALAAAPIVGKLAKPGLASAVSELARPSQPSNLFKWRDELWSGVKEGKGFKDEPALWRAMSREEYDALVRDGVLKPRVDSEGAIYVTSDADRVATPGGSYGGKTSGGVIVRLKKSDTVPMKSRNVRGLDEIGVPQISKDDVTGVWDAQSGDLLGDLPSLIDPQMAAGGAALAAAPIVGKLAYNPQRAARAASLRLKIDPLESSLKKALKSKDAEQASKLREKLKAIRAEIDTLDPVPVWRYNEMVKQGGGE